MNETVQAAIVAVILGVCAFFILRKIRRYTSRRSCDKPRSACPGCDEKCPLRRENR